MKHVVGRLLSLALGACLLLNICAAAAEPVYVTRGEFVVRLYETAGKPTEPRDNALFLDVDGQSPYFKALAWAKALKIVEGYDGNWFRPEVLVTREQAAALLLRYQKASGAKAVIPEGDPLAAFEDVDRVSPWCLPAVRWAVDNGFWFSGDYGLLKPQECITAEECVVLLERLTRGGMKLAHRTESFNRGPVTMEAVALSPTGATLRLSNQTDKPVTYGADYYLQRKVNNGWYALYDSIPVILMLYTISPGQTQDLTVNWEHLLPVGTLTAGEYRLTKTLCGEENGAYDLATDFTIKPAA